MQLSLSIPFKIHVKKNSNNSNCFYFSYFINGHLIDPYNITIQQVHIYRLSIYTMYKIWNNNESTELVWKFLNQKIWTSAKKFCCCILKFEKCFFFFTQRILRECSCIIEFIKWVGEKIRCEALWRILSVFPNKFNKFNNTALSMNAWFCLSWH